MASGGGADGEWWPWWRAQRAVNTYGRRGCAWPSCRALESASLSRQLWRHAPPIIPSASKGIAGRGGGGPPAPSETKRRSKARGASDGLSSHVFSRPLLPLSPSARRGPVRGGGCQGALFAVGSMFFTHAHDEFFIYFFRETRCPGWATAEVRTGRRYLPLVRSPKPTRYRALRFRFSVTTHVARLARGEVSFL